MNERNSLIISIPRDWYVWFILLILMLINYLPVVYAGPRLIISMIEISLAGIMLFFMASTDSNMFLKNSVILVVIFFINLLAYYHCWINTLPIGSFVIRSCMCWFYMGIGIFLKKYGSKETNRSVFHLILLLMVVTSLTSIIVARDYPTAMRGLENGSVDIKGIEKTLYKRNTATWSMVYAMTFAIPYTIVAYRKTKKLIYVFIITILSYCIFRSQITMALLMSAMFLLLFILKPSSPKKTCIIIGLLIILAMLFSDEVAELIYWLYINLFGGNTNNMLGKRFYQLYISVRDMQLVGTYSGRFDLYLTSIRTFLDNPIIGIDTHNIGNISYSELTNIVGLHSQFFDMLATTGIVCTGIVVGSFLYYVRIMDKLIEDYDDKNLFSYTIFVLVIFILLNPTYYSACVFLTVFLGPSFLQALEESDRKRRFSFR